MCRLFAVMVQTLGCRLNQTESEGLAFIFAKEGFRVLDRETVHHKGCQEEPLLLCIVNTCTVTSKAEQKARRLIRLLLKKSERLVVLVTGCYAQLEAGKIEEMDERIVTFQGKKKDALLYLPQYLKERCSACSVLPCNRDVAFLKNLLLLFKAEYEERSTLLQAGGFSCERQDLLNITSSKFIPLFALSAPTFMFHSRATLKVQDGCDNACSFCRIRLARGKAVSLPINEAVRRIKELEEKGAAEVVITGVNLSQYKDADYEFAHLLEHLLLATSKIRIRISSLYPESITPSFLSVASEKRVCPHFHLSIQSGSDEILTKMGRRYTRARVYEAVRDLRKAKKMPFIGCDIIAGFPGESEEDFLLTVKMCCELKFAGIHAFPFSPRPGTLGARMKGKVSERMAGERVNVLNNIAKKNYEEYLASFEGVRLFAVVEEAGGVFSVTTENYLQLPLKAHKLNIKAGDYLFVCVVGNEAVEVE